MQRVAAVVLVTIGLSACALVGPEGGEPVVVDGITLLTHLGSDDDAYPAALGSGKLTVRDGCIAMDGSRGPAVFILWPPGYSLRTRGETVEVTDADSDLVAAPGDPITLGGGFGDLAWADELTGGRIPNECRDGAVERYFLATPDAWPFAETDGVTLLRHDGNRLSGDTALLEGTLAAVDGCVAIEGGPWLLWPIDYGVSQDQAPPLEIEVADRKASTIGTWEQSRSSPRDCRHVHGVSTQPKRDAEGVRSADLGVDNVSDRDRIIEGRSSSEHSTWGRDVANRQEGLFSESSDPEEKPISRETLRSPEMQAKIERARRIARESEGGFGKTADDLIKLAREQRSVDSRAQRRAGDPPSVAGLGA